MKATHDGEQLEKMVKEAGMKIGIFARLMRVSRNTPRNWFDTPHHEDALLLRAARILNADAVHYFPRLKGIVAHPLHNLAQNIPAEQGAQSSTAAPDAQRDCQQQLSATQQKLIETLEQYNKLLLDYNQLLRSLGKPHPTGGGGSLLSQPLHSPRITY